MWVLNVTTDVLRSNVTEDIKGSYADFTEEDAGPSNARKMALELVEQHPFSHKIVPQITQHALEPSFFVK